MVLAEYAEMLQIEKHKLRLFEKSSDRLDKFYLELLKFSSSYSELWRVVELLLVLSHSQTTVKKGLSVNQQVSEETSKACHTSRNVLYVIPLIRQVVPLTSL